MATIIPSFLCDRPGEAYPESSRTGWPGLTFDEQGFRQGAGDGSPPLLEGHHRIYNVHQRILAEGDSCLMFIRGMTRTNIDH